MRRDRRFPVSCVLAVLIGALIHVDWHFARPHHHRLSLEWSSHWIACIVGFGAVAAYIARRWPDRPWKAAASVFGWGIIIGQVVEPLLESAFYERRFGYDVEPERWVAFGQCAGAGLATAVIVLLLMRRIVPPSNSQDPNVAPLSGGVPRG